MFFISGLRIEASYCDTVMYGHFDVLWHFFTLDDGEQYYCVLTSMYTAKPVILSIKGFEMQDEPAAGG